MPAGRERKVQRKSNLYGT